MNIKRTSWYILFFFAILSLSVWYKFSYPQLAFLDLSTDRNQALNIATEYLKSRGYEPDSYTTAIVFQTDTKADRYLQKTLGFDGLLEFIKEENFDMFYWMIRFFKANQKEGFRVAVSSTTGEVINFRHLIDDSEARNTVSREEAKAKAVEFLKENFGFKPELYFIKGDLLTKRDYRSEYAFSWQKEDVHIPWSEKPNSGIGKIVSSVLISGDEILGFSKNAFLTPDQFERHLEQQKNVGRNLSSIMQIFYYILLIASIYYITSRRNHLAMHLTKKFYIGVILFSFLLSILSYLNQFQSILFDFKTTSNMEDYLIRSAINGITSSFFLTIIMIMPALSGELLHFETFRDHRQGSFLHYIRTAFLSRSAAGSILLGYLVFMIMLGIQSLMIKLGQDHLGVWVEHSWMSKMTTAYIPFLAAFTIAFQASFMEEIMYRMFGLSWGKKILGSIVISVVVMSLIWGFSHSSYPVFPMWFRGIEVTFLGLFLSFVYLRYGLIAVIVGHFLFNAFWNTAGYLLGHTRMIYFLPAVCLLLLPLALALLAFIINKNVEPKPLRWHLNKHQLYNLEIIKTFINMNRGKFGDRTREEVKKDLLTHGWDVAVVDTALEDLDKEREQGRG